MTTCECVNWCEIDHRPRLLTGHHERCEHGGIEAQNLALYALVKELADGLTAYGQDTDGVHPDAWKPYCKAMALQLIFINPNEVPQ